MITSVSNNLVKMAASLRHKKGRLERKLYLIEGIHLVIEAMKARAPIRQYLWNEKILESGEGKELLSKLARLAEGVEVSEAVFSKIAETETPQGILALVELPETGGFDLTKYSFGLIVDGVQDPGNLGAIIRTAWAAGVDCLLLTAGTADPYQGKVVRATMGGIFQQPIYRDLLPDVIAAAAGRGGFQIIAGYPGAARLYFETNLEPPTLLLVGNEGRGAAEEWERLPIQKVRIPQAGGAESLNVAIAAGVLVFEVIRQRLTKGTCKSRPALL